MAEIKTCTVWHYSIVPEVLFRVELGEYHTYGIRMTTPENSHTVHDVSVCKKTAEHIVEILNQYHISPKHLYDIVDRIF